jgi:superfamily II DNA or RNA helicase
MNYNDLLEKYRALLNENRTLKERLNQFETKTEIDSENEYSVSKESGLISTQNEPELEKLAKLINKFSSTDEKIDLYMSLFKGRVDVYATKWENQKKGTSGYSPACANEWVTGVCQKPRIKCSVCKNKNYLELNRRAIERHLRGEMIIGIYPLLHDETSWFLAADFDEGKWQQDISAFRNVCSQFDIPIYIERSRSGNGAHAWFFFEQAVSASTARKFGSTLLTHAMNLRHEITFKSYDRLFPNQDTMPKGGFGNLIALPLQKSARENNNSVFVDENFEAVKDQWAYLSCLEKLSLQKIESFLSDLYQENELGILRKDEEEENIKPWETRVKKLGKNNFPEKVEIVKANMLFINKVGFSQKALNQLKRLSAFKNPEFYKAQAMRLSTFNKPRIISCAEDTGDYISLPRGCETELNILLSGLKINSSWIDKQHTGQKIKVEFKGQLRDEQPIAVAELLKHEIGVLCGTTAFGKTVVAIKLIAERQVNTLILVNKVSLVNQWRERLNEFLTFHEPIGTGKSNNQSFIGQIGAGKQKPSGIIDIAIMQSLTRKGEVKDFINDYGMVIVDECHHVPAFSFELILKSVKAKFIYGLTATPSRKDGHHPIIFMHCGPIRYRDDAKKQAEKRPFEHYIVPRFTSFRIHKLTEKEEKEWTIQELYAELVKNEIRNQQIVDDVVRCYHEGKNCIVLTERVEHVKILTAHINEKTSDVISVTGGMGTKETRLTLQKLSGIPGEKPLIIVATGRFIGEGFDEPRLDTLFLAMPISWKGTLQQYAGRLHRLFEGKNEALIYDYIDIHVRMLERMYNRRLSGYASIGYKMKGEIFTSSTQKEENLDIIFDKSNFYPVFINDLMHANREILIVSPFVTKKRTIQFLHDLQPALSKNIKVVIVTRPAEDFGNKDSNLWQEAIEKIKAANIHLIFKSKIHQKFAIIDQKTIWYGSINLLSYGSSEESMMRIESTKIAYELIGSLEKNE